MPPCHSESNGRESRVVVSSLSHQLYDRNARRAFAPAEHWHWPSVAVREIESAEIERRGGDVAMGGGAAGGGGDHHPGADASVLTFVGTGRLALVLTCVPQVLPFAQRVALFHRFLDVDKQTTQGEFSRSAVSGWNRFLGGYSGRCGGRRPLH